MINPAWINTKLFWFKRIKNKMNRWLGSNFFLCSVLFPFHRNSFWDRTFALNIEYIYLFLWGKNFQHRNIETKKAIEEEWFYRYLKIDWNLSIFHFTSLSDIMLMAADFFSLKYYLLLLWYTSTQQFSEESS